MPQPYLSACCGLVKVTVKLRMYEVSHILIGRGSLPVSMPDIYDDKSQYCIPFILRRLALHRQAFPEQSPPPFFIGLNGVQGVGKTTLVSDM